MNQHEGVMNNRKKAGSQLGGVRVQSMKGNVTQQQSQNASNVNRSFQRQNSQVRTRNINMQRSKDTQSSIKTTHKRDSMH